MALIVETGSVVAGADSYVDLTYATTYHSTRGNTAWGSAAAPAQETCLRLAAQYLDAKYLARWKGTKISALQARQWPRWGVYLDNSRDFSSETYDVGIQHGMLPSNAIPDQVKQAQCELAIRALSGPLAPDLARGGMIQSKQIAGVLSTTYAPGAPPGMVYQFVTMLLAELLNPTNQLSIVRG